MIFHFYLKGCKFLSESQSQTFKVSTVVISNEVFSGVQFYNVGLSVNGSRANKMILIIDEHNNTSNVIPIFPGQRPVIYVANTYVLYIIYIQ
jgi:hypothetical protein